MTAGSLTAGTAANVGLILVEGAIVTVEDADSSVYLGGEDFIHLNSGSAVLSGAAFVDDDPVKTTEGNTTLTVETTGELNLSGSVTANGALNLISGRTNEDLADYFDTLPGKTLAATDAGDATTRDAILAAIRTGTISPELRALIDDNGIALANSGVTVTAVDTYTPFFSLTDEQRAEVVSFLGYTAYAEGGFYNPDAPAGLQFTEELNMSDLAPASQQAGYTHYAGTVYFKAGAEKELLTGFVAGESADFSIDQIAWGSVAKPAAGTDFKDMSAEQRLVVAQSLGYATDDGGKTYFNYNADYGKKLIKPFAAADKGFSTFSEGPLTDYRNSDIYWGASAVGDPNVVAASLGYEVFTSGVWYNPNAAAAERIVKGFTTEPVHVRLDLLDWGGPGAPAEGATFEQLSFEQRVLVAQSEGYQLYDGQLFSNPNALIPGDRLIPLLVQGPDDDAHYSNEVVEGGANSNPVIDWGDLPVPVTGTPFEALTEAQQDHVLAQLGYTRFSGQVFYDPNTSSASERYKLTFAQGEGADFDYNNDDIIWSKVPIPAADTPFDDPEYEPPSDPALVDPDAELSDEQRYLVQEQSGYTRYQTPVYYKAATNDFRQTFIEDDAGDGDYRNAEVFPGEVVGPVTRWTVSDRSHTYIVYAYDEAGDGEPDLVKVLEPHQLHGQRGYGFLLTGTLTTLKDGVGITVTGADEAIVQGSVNLLGANADLVVQSDKWVYWQGKAEVTGNIALIGGLELDLSVPTTGAGAHPVTGGVLDGVSLYVHEVSVLNTLGAGTQIVLAGGQDVVLMGATVAGGTIGSSGVTWAEGGDSTITVQAGQQIDVETSLMASRSTTLKTTGAPGAGDEGFGLILGTKGGLTGAGLSTSQPGGGVFIDSAADITLMGSILAGGRMDQVYENGSLKSETISWYDNQSSITINTDGQLWLGGMAATQSGGTADTGKPFSAV